MVLPILAMNWFFLPKVSTSNGIQINTRRDEEKENETTPIIPPVSLRVAQNSIMYAP